MVLGCWAVWTAALFLHWPATVGAQSGDGEDCPVMFQVLRELLVRSRIPSVFNPLAIQCDT